MTFERYTDVIREGDIAIMYRGHNDLVPITIKSGQVLNIKAGSFKYDDFIGKPWGSKFGGHKGNGHITLLYPTPELWTLSLPHRTQILYHADISIITTRLRLKPGCQVVESGTGSGSFSHSIIRSIAPTGHLYTYEYHKDRAEAATKEFKQHGLSSHVTVECRDVCKQGFPLQDKIDAIFLDLPAPWEAIPAATKTLNSQRVTRICCFSPCIEQVNRTCESLREQGYVDIEMVECLLREHDIRKVSVRTADGARSMSSKRLPRPDKKMRWVQVQVQDQPLPEQNNDNDNDNDNNEEDNCHQQSSSLIFTTTSFRPRQDARGHTSYLTFATKLPVIIPTVAGNSA